eukprot:SAG11_NODE_12491_length_700_cov_3.845258_1_plen_148_part_00
MNLIQLRDIWPSPPYDFYSPCSPPYDFFIRSVSMLVSMVLLVSTCTSSTGTGTGTATHVYWILYFRLSTTAAVLLVLFVPRIWYDTADHMAWAESSLRLFCLICEIADYQNLRIYAQNRLGPPGTIGTRIVPIRIFHYEVIFLQLPY